MKVVPVLYPKLISSCRVANDFIGFWVFHECVEMNSYDHSKKKLEKVTKISFEGTTIQQAHMSECLIVLVTTNGYLVVIFFKPHKHYMMTAKLGEGISVKVLEILGVNNHIFLHDSANKSFLISINEEYSKRSALDFVATHKDDLFIVTELTFQQEEPKPVQIVSILKGSTKKPKGLIKYLLDSEGKVYFLNVPSTEEFMIETAALQNYLRSHNFEYKSIFLPSSRCHSLEEGILSPKKQLEVN